MAPAAQPDPQLAAAQGAYEPARLLVLTLRGDQRGQLGVRVLPAGGLLVDPLVVGRRADLDPVLGEHLAHGLDTPAQPDPAGGGVGHLVVLVLGDEPDHRFAGRSSSAAKKAEAAFKISFARRSSATSLRSALFSA